MLCVIGEVETVYGGGLFLLVGEFEGVCTVYLEVLVEGSSDETSPSTADLHTANGLFVVAGRKQLPAHSQIPQEYSWSST